MILSYHFPQSAIVSTTVMHFLFHCKNRNEQKMYCHFNPLDFKVCKPNSRQIMVDKGPDTLVGFFSGVPVIYY